MEGESERVVLPYMFSLNNIDVNESGVSIIDVGSKNNLEFFIKIAKAFSIPFVVLHDEDRNANNYATYHAGTAGLNARIKQAANDASLVYSFDPDFEGILGLQNKSLLEKINKVKTLTLLTIPPVIDNVIQKLMSL